ncbi:FdtA/QdtA family cupin domain-containing protein [Antarcticibacterium sp. 1MA-6-2]|nr:WxcM-like domain-containing protein [Antarcticibacterium sp. 1MA-6-2]UJH91292.1 FdtA/QdtA family cupin domain-containing protein [Antarcticibacterium sp. 1MA-6-2]
MSNFSTNAMVMFLGSASNDQEDIIRDYEEFQKMKNL